MRGSIGGSLNNPVVGLPDLRMNTFLPPISSCHRGGGRGNMEDRWSRLRRPDKSIQAWSTSSVVTAEKVLALSGDFSLPGKSFSWRLTAGLRCFAADLSDQMAAILFLPVEYQKGGSTDQTRRPLLRLTSRRRGGGELTAPSGVVPGGDALGPVGDPIHGTGLRFASVIWGLLCKVSGLSCIFYLLRGPDVRCAIVDLS